MQITKIMIEKAYYLARLVIEDGMIESKAACCLANETGMNKNSSKIYMRCFVSLLGNGKYGRTVNEVALEFCFKKILDDYGKNRLISALNIFDSHAEKNKNPLINLKKIVARYRQTLI